MLHALEVYGMAVGFPLPGYCNWVLTLQKGHYVDVLSCYDV
jgi:hypothetical protein